ncbi:unnamed protein product [Zymoseptoria tritici ST99CH_3D1]|nr:unnamed protein product [Zymoseptoria tritici ST99CH_3D1]
MRDEDELRAEVEERLLHETPLTIPQTDPRQIRWRYGTLDQHELTMDLKKKQEFDDFSRLFEKERLPTQALVLPVSMDPREHIEDRYWRDMIRTFLNLVPKKAKLMEISMLDEVGDDEYETVVWSRLREEDVEWGEARDWFKDQSRAVIFQFLVQFPTDNSYLKDMEWPHPIDPATAAAICSVNAVNTQRDGRIKDGVVARDDAAGGDDEADADVDLETEAAPFIGDGVDHEGELQRVAQTIAQQDPREMYFGGGTEEDHTLLSEDFSLEGANRLKRDYTRHGVPRQHKPLPPALDPRNNENEENWRDRWRMFLELQTKGARLGQISMHDLNQPDEDPEVLWSYDRGSELSWTDLQIYIKDGNDRKVVFTIVLVFPSDDSYLQDMESARPLDPNTDRIMAMAMVEAEEKRSDAAMATSTGEEGAAVIIDDDGGAANDVDTGGVRNDLLDATALTKEKKPISAPSTRS